MIFSRCIAFAFIGVCAAINIRHGAKATIGEIATPTITHLIKDPIGALGADSMGSVAQAMAGPEVDEAIAKQLEMINTNPFDSESAKKGHQDLKEVHSKIKRYLGKLNKLYAIAAPPPDDDTPKHLVENADQSANATNSDDDEEEKEEDAPDLKMPQLRKAVLTAAIKKAASSALQAADSKMKENMAEEEARHNAAVQNLTSVALKEKASTLTAKWRVQQALKMKKKAREALSKLQTHDMKTQMAIATLTEHQASVRTDITEAHKEVEEAKKIVAERIKQFREQQKVFRTAQDALLEEKATQIQAMFEKQSNGEAQTKDAKVDSNSMEKFLSVRN